MSHWFDRVSMRASGDEPVTRREALKTAAIGTAAAGALVSPTVAQAAKALERRQDACRCQEQARDRYNKSVDRLADLVVTPASLISPLPLVIFVVGGTGALVGLGLADLNCGKCNDSPSGGNHPAPPSFTPCTTARGGLRRGPECPGDGGGSTDCPSGTTRCSDSLCCYGNDNCCTCKSGDLICCIADVGCDCC